MFTNLRKYLLLLFISSLFIAGHTEAKSLPRCQEVAQQVRVYHSEAFGVDFPYGFSVGQLQQESNCRNVLSRDGVGSEGLPQITYRLWKPYLQKKGVNDLKTVGNQLKAQAYINKSAYGEASYKKLWVMYQVYNGGGLVNKEIKLAGKPDWNAAKAKCKRKTVHYLDGSSENACDINYDYSKRIFRYGQEYGTTVSDKFPFW